MVLSILTFGLMFSVVNIIGYSSTVSTVIYLITFSVILNAFTGVLNAVFQANEKMEYVSVSTILSSAAMLVGTAVGIYYHYDVIYFAMLYIISYGLVFIYISIMVSTGCRGQVRRSTNALKDIEPPCQEKVQKTLKLSNDQRDHRENWC